MVTSESFSTQKFHYCAYIVCKYYLHNCSQQQPFYVLVLFIIVSLHTQGISMDLVAKINDMCISKQGVDHVPRRLLLIPRRFHKKDATATMTKATAIWIYSESIPHHLGRDPDFAINIAPHLVVASTFMHSCFIDHQLKTHSITPCVMRKCLRCFCQGILFYFKYILILMQQYGLSTESMQKSNV